MMMTPGGMEEMRRRVESMTPEQRQQMAPNAALRRADQVRDSESSISGHCAERVYHVRSRLYNRNGEMLQLVQVPIEQMYDFGTRSA